MFYLLMLLPAILQEIPDWKNLDEVLLWVIGGGFAVIVAAVFSFLAENFEFWHKIPKYGKLVISFVLSALIGAGAYYLLSMPELITFIQPYWALIVAMFLAWLGSQVAYIYAKKSDYAAKTRAAALGK